MLQSFFKNNKHTFVLLNFLHLDTYLLFKIILGIIIKDEWVLLVLIPLIPTMTHSLKQMGYNLHLECPPQAHILNTWPTILKTMELLGDRAWWIDIINYGWSLMTILASSSELHTLCPVHHYVNKPPLHATTTMDRVSLASLIFKQW